MILLSRKILVAFLLTLLISCDQTSGLEEGSAISSIFETDTSSSDHLKPRTFEFPKDHGPHPSFPIEWWHVVSDLSTSDGRRYGLQLTVFRRFNDSYNDANNSEWNSNQLFMAHIAITDVSTEKHTAYESLQRGGELGLAGAHENGEIIWVNNSILKRIPSSNEKWTLKVNHRDIKVDLTLSTMSKPVLHGNNGVSEKGPIGVSSYYYSIPLLKAFGKISVNDSAFFEVSGNSWIDREWSNGASNSDLSSWVWIALWLNENTQLMAYRTFSVSDKEVNTFDYLSIIQDGKIDVLPNSRFEITKNRQCRVASQANFNCGYDIQIGEHKSYKIIPTVDDQTHNGLFHYWEGLVDVYDNNGIVGSGYLENTRAE